MLFNKFSAIALAGVFASASAYAVPSFTVPATGSVLTSGLGEPATPGVTLGGSSNGASGLSIATYSGTVTDTRFNNGIDQVTGATTFSTYTFSSTVTSFYGTWNLSPKGEDAPASGVWPFLTAGDVDPLTLTFYRTGGVQVGQFSFFNDTTAIGSTTDTFGAGYQLAGGFNYFTVTTTAGKTETFSLTNVSAVTPVPEPETYAMMLAGLGAIGFMARRRKING